jgi:hypothetical protein
VADEQTYFWSHVYLYTEFSKKNFMKSGRAEAVPVALGVF